MIDSLVEVRETFRSNVREVQLIAGIADKGEELTVANALYRAASVLLVSHFESFLKDVAEVFVDSLNDGSLTSRRIPVGLRKIHTLPYLESAVSGSDERQQITNLKKLDRITCFWKDDAKPSANSLDPKKLSRQVTSAHPDKINRLYRLMGHGEDICSGQVKSECDSADDDSSGGYYIVNLILKDVVKCRNDIAHGDSDRTPTGEDVRRYSDFLTAFSSSLAFQANALIEEVRS